jgi:probable phosphoglycerate mutase
MIIYIVRHGQTVENKTNILQGHLPGQLTEAGIEQMRETAERLAHENVSFRCIVSSDLARAMDSANIIARRLNLPVEAKQSLRERDWGTYTGIPFAEAKEKYRVNGTWHFPDGSVESEEEFYSRAQQALNELRSEHKDDAIIVVTHGLFTRFLRAAHSGQFWRDIPTMMNAEFVKIEL